MNQCSASLVNPNDLIFEIRIEWLRVSNAFDRSINKAPTIFPLSISLLISSVKNSVASSVDRPFLYPN